ncbi:MAG: hypothetical protein HUU46_10965 [Candidatus Hydrogenedentes bacterium]|nr:hypothetical protein [Candidatus Hydrogenedentota bacterium]
MIVHRCDGCGKELAKGQLRYHVKIDVRAAYDKLEIGLADLVRDHRSEMLKLIERMRHKDPREIEETVYKGFELDLCPSCQRAYIKGPLRFHPEQGAPESDIDIDSFLRSLGLDKPVDDATES